MNWAHRLKRQAQRIKDAWLWFSLYQSFRALTSGWNITAVCVSVSFGLGTDGITQPKRKKVFSLPASCLPDLGRGLKVSPETDIFALITEAQYLFGQNILFSVSLGSQDKEGIFGAARVCSHLGQELLGQELYTFLCCEAPGLKTDYLCAQQETCLFRKNTVK